MKFEEETDVIFCRKRKALKREDQIVLRRILEYNKVEEGRMEKNNAFEKTSKRVGKTDRKPAID